MLQMSYVVPLWGPVLVIFLMGLLLLLEESVVYKMIAVSFPLLLGGTEMMILTTVLEQGDAISKESELLDVMFVQSGALGIVSGIFLAILFISWLYKVLRKEKKKEVPLGI